MSEKCTANGLQEGDLVDNQFASIFCLSKQSKASAVKHLYELIKKNMPSLLLSTVH